MKKTVFIHTNDQQMVGAIVGRHSLQRMSKNPERFDVKIVRRETYDVFNEHEGKKFLRAGGWRTWRNDDLQSFTPVRFTPPEEMDYQGRALVIDPDVFAVGDVNELFERDLEGKAILARPRSGHNGREDYIATSVMLLDCAKLTHWNMQAQFQKMFTGELDYEDWIVLATEPRGSIGHLEEIWNHFDKVTPGTRLLHNTKRRTQPWKTGLPIDFTNRLPFIGKLVPNAGIRIPGKYKQHPDIRQEQFFFSLLQECFDSGQISEAELKREMAANHVRHDALQMMKSAPPLDVAIEQFAA